MINQKTVTHLAYQVMSCAIEVHNHVGPGLLESVYQDCLAHELKLRGFDVWEQAEVPVHYKGMIPKTPLRLDMLVNQLVIVEVKAVENLLPIHTAQIISYLKLAQKPKGLLINFHSKSITASSKSYVSEYFAALPKE